MIYRTPLTKINDYFEDKRISQSQLKLYQRGWDYYQKNQCKDLSEKYFDEPKDHFLIGSAVDVKMTHEESDFSDLYYVSSLIKKPSEAEISIIRYVFDQVIDQFHEEFPNMPFIPSCTSELNSFTAFLSEAFTYHNYYSNWGFEAKLKVFSTPDMQNYWQEIFKSHGKQILTLQDFNLITTMCETLQNSRTTAHLFNDTNPDVDIFYQVPVYSETENNIHIKGLMDIVVVNYHTHQIEIYDLKTMAESPCTFPVDYKKRGYGFQGAFYFNMKEKIVSSIKNNYSFSRSRELLSSFEVVDFKFAVVSKLYPKSKALCFSMGKNELDQIICGKSISFSHSTDKHGNFYEHHHREQLGIESLVYYFEMSLDLETDHRFDDNVLNISNYI